MRLLAVFFIAILSTSSFAIEATVDRSSSRPTEWFWRTNVTLTEAKNYALQKGARIFNLEKMPSSTKYAALMVKNTGDYKATRWWITSGSINSLKAFLSNLKNNGKPARIIDLEPIGNNKFAIAAVQNSGANAKSWWWYVGLNAQQLKDKKNQHNARIAALESYVVSGKTYYAAVLIKKAGEDNKGWWYYRNISFNTVREKRTLHGNAHIVDLDRLSNGNFDVVFEKKSNKKFWWHTNRTAAQVRELLAQTKSRLVDVEPYKVGSSTRYMVVTVDNANALERRVRDFYARRASGAQRGFYLKRVGGSTLASVRARTQFVPASSLKALYHFVALQRVERNNLNLTTAMRTLCGAESASNAPAMSGTNTCPLSTNRCEFATSTVSLQQLLTRMMVNSNNRHTQVVREIVGQARINQVAQELGMTDTLVRERIGCGENICLDNNNNERYCSTTNSQSIVDNGYRGAPLQGNSASLRDYGLLYEASLSVAQLGEQRDNFAAFMLNENNNQWLRNVANQQNATVGLSNADLADFRNRLTYYWKGGSYTNTGASVIHFSRAGVARIPVKSRGSIISRDFVFGVFQNLGPSNQSNQMQAVASELLREEVRKALLTWK